MTLELNVCACHRCAYPVSSIFLLFAVAFGNLVSNRVHKSLIMRSSLCPTRRFIIHLVYERPPRTTCPTIFLPVQNVSGTTPAVGKDSSRNANLAQISTIGVCPHERRPISAHMKIDGGSKVARRQAEEWLAPLKEHLADGGLGHISEIFDGDAPHRPVGCIAQAWSVAEVLRATVEDVCGIRPQRPAGLLEAVAQ